MKSGSNVVDELSFSRREKEIAKEFMERERAMMMRTRGSEQSVEQLLEI